MKKIVLIALLVVTVALMVLPIWAGKKTEGFIHTQVNRQQTFLAQKNLPAKIFVSNYQRGFLRSQAQVHLAPLQDSEGEPVVLVVDAVHAPFTLSGTNWMRATVRVNDEVFADMPALDMALSFTGNLHIGQVFPAGKQSDTLTVNAAGETKAIRSEGLAWSLSGAAETFPWQSDGSLVFEGLSVSDDQYGLSIAPFTLNLRMDLEQGFRLSVPEIDYSMTVPFDPAPGQATSNSQMTLRVGYEDYQLNMPKLAIDERFYFSGIDAGAGRLTIDTLPPFFEFSANNYGVRLRLSPDNTREGLYQLSYGINMNEIELMAPMQALYADLIPSDINAGISLTGISEQSVLAVYRLIEEALDFAHLDLSEDERTARFEQLFAEYVEPAFVANVIDEDVVLSGSLKLLNESSHVVLLGEVFEHISSQADVDLFTQEDSQLSEGELRTKLAMIDGSYGSVRISEAVVKRMAQFGRNESDLPPPFILQDGEYRLDAKIEDGKPWLNGQAQPFPPRQ